MKLRHYTIIATLALLAASCAHEESEVAQISDVQVVIEASFAETKSTTKSTATAFESGDLLGLYAVKSGGELNAASNLINNHQLKVAESGAIVGDQLPAYYPDKSSSLDLFSYFPYQSGNATADALGVLVGIRTHQTDFSSLMASDLCYGQKLDAAPSAAPHPLQFRHSFAQLRLNFTLYEGCSAISAVKLLAIKDSAKLNLQTGLVTLLTSSVVDVVPFVNNTLSYTAIVPAQSLSGACVEITLTDGTIYYYHATSPIALKESATNTLNLTLSDKGKLTLASTPAITAWGVEEFASNISESTDNAFTFYWSPAITSFGSIDKAFVTLTNPATKKSARIEVTAFVRDATSTAANAIFRFAITRADAASIGYPVTIDKFELFNGGTAVHTLTDYYGRTVTRSGAHTFGTVTSIKLSETTWNNVSGYGDSKTITVTTTGTQEWTATSSNAALTVTKSGNNLTLTWAENTNGSLTTSSRSSNITLETVPAGAKAILPTTQVGVTPLANSVRINGIWWATGNLVADGANGAKIGAPGDGGLFFQFGSLIGWTGGTDGDGTGVPANFNPLTPYLAIQIKPTTYPLTPTWAACPLLGDGTDVPFATDNGASAIGDPCRFYLGSNWRLPRYEEFLRVTNYSSWTTNGSVNGCWFGPTSGWSSVNAIWLPASGLRYFNAGPLTSVSQRCCYWTSVTWEGAHAAFLDIFVSGGNALIGAAAKTYGFPVRCVSN